MILLLGLNKTKVLKTNVNGWHSQTNMHEIPQFKPLVDELFKMQQKYLKKNG